MEFKLSAQLIAHEDDVRGVCICGENTIATASRDQTVRLWTSDESQKYEVTKTLRGHSSFVGAVAWVPPCPELPSGGLVSGGMDTVVIVWKMDSVEPFKYFQGHESQVMSLVCGKDGEIYSASIDRTIRRWKSDGTADVLKGHQAPVQALAVLPDGVLVSGSSDSTIKFWKGSSCIKTINAHTDTVRGLALMPEVGFVSASHDATVKLWSSSGQPLLEMVGHSNIVYSVAAHPSGVIASGSEDGYAKIWRGSTCVQSIQHPGCVWDLKFMPNGDLVTACSDGAARIWTSDPSRFASSEEIEAFEAAVTSRNLERKVGGLKVSELPGLEALHQPGTSNGQTKMIREGDHAVAYSWNGKEYKWDKIGEVVDGPEDASSGKTLDGVTYDYVFNVDIGDDQPTRQLPYNRGENPYETAEKWLVSQGLPMEYKQQVVDFILKNSGQPDGFMELDNCFYDPYTGANAYVPSQQQNTRRTNPPVYKLKHIPRKDMLLFDAAPQSDGLLKKLKEFNSTVRVDARLSDQELDMIKEMLTNSAALALESSFDIWIRKVVSWPATNLFPVLDFLRFAILNLQVATYFSEEKDLLLDLVKAAVVMPAPPPNVFLSIRLLVNCFRHECFRSWLLNYRGEVLDLFSNAGSSTNKSVRSAYVHLILNYSLRLIASKDEEGQTQILSAALEMAGPEEAESDRLLALEAIGTLIHSGLVKSTAKELGIQSLVQDAKNSKNSKLAEIGADLDYLLK